MRTAVRRFGFRALTASATIVCLLAAVDSATAFTMDARRLGMGSVLMPRQSALVSANIAYQAVADRPDDRGRVIPLPLGLVQLASDFPTLDASSQSFDVLRITETILNPPFFLELNHPSSLDGDIGISIGRNAFAVDFADAQGLLPQDPIRTGAVYSPPIFGLGIRGAQSFVAPLLQAEGHLGMDDPLYDVVSHGAPLLPNSAYTLDADAASMVGTSFNVGWSGGGWGGTGGDGLYVGAFAKYILGFAFGEAQTKFGLATADTIFGDRDPLDVTFDAYTRYAPFGRIGNGVGLDAGVAYRIGAVDVGLGIRDIASNVWFGGTELEHSYLDQVTGEIVSENVLSGERYRWHLPTQTTLNIGWTGDATILAADLTTTRWATTAHMGAERRISMLALRGGLLTDERHHLQYACGMGVGFGSVWLDLGLQSHGFALTDERGWTLGTSLAIR